MEGILMRVVGVAGVLGCLVVLAVVLACRLEECISSLDWSYVGAVGVGCIMVVVMLCCVIGSDDVE